MVVKRHSTSFSGVEVKFLTHVIRTVSKDHPHLISAEGYASTYRKIIAMQGKVELHEADEALFEEAPPLRDAADPNGGKNAPALGASV
jgi:hypothetical protein